ncbi:hypothetical protein OAS39_06755 [Pirellulales bacterium]|nr:hypothetical protein [Pirellulales bacterium]
METKHVHNSMVPRIQNDLPLRLTPPAHVPQAAGVVARVASINESMIDPKGVRQAWNRSSCIVVIDELLTQVGLDHMIAQRRLRRRRGAEAVFEKKTEYEKNLA